MKLNEQDKKLLIEWGFEKYDFSQIEVAMQKSKTKYIFHGKEISRELVIEILGKEEYLSGIARSAFHFTSYRRTKHGDGILFDSSRLFELFGK